MLRVAFYLLVVTFAYHCFIYLLWLYEARVHGGGLPRAPALTWLGAWLGEWLASVIVFIASALGLFAARFGSRRPPRGASERAPVLLLHGWGLTPASMALLAARLRRDGRDVIALSYPSLAADLEVKAAHVARELRGLSERFAGMRFDIVAHSQAGVVVRAAARREDCLTHIDRVITLGAPHHGTALAAVLGWKRLAQLRPNSPYLERLAADDPLARERELVSIYSTFDAVVFPADLSQHREAFNIVIDWTGHHGLLLSERVYQLIRENLDAPVRNSTH